MAKKTSKKSPKNTRKKTSKQPGTSAATRRAPKPGDSKPRASKAVGGKADGPVLLTGGNPQIAKGDGDRPVQAYIAAMPGWKHDVGRRLDRLITREVPGVRKAVRWNSPFYGVEGGGWFLNVHCLTRYVKIAFFDGESLRPVPPVGSKKPGVRYVHVFEDHGLDEAQLTEWVRQAVKLPGVDWF